MNQKKHGVSENDGHSHSNHMWIMAICCGLPIIGFLALVVLGISLPSLETALLLICPIGMIGMMYMMHRDSSARDSDQGCDKSEQIKDVHSLNIAFEGDKTAEQNPADSKQPGSLKA